MRACAHERLQSAAFALRRTSSRDPHSHSSVMIMCGCVFVTTPYSFWTCQAREGRCVCVCVYVNVMVCACVCLEVCVCVCVNELTLMCSGNANVCMVYAASKKRLCSSDPSGWFSTLMATWG